MMAAGDLVGSPLAAALDPRVDQTTVDAQMRSARYPQSDDVPAPADEQAQFELDLSLQEPGVVKVPDPQSTPDKPID